MNRLDDCCILPDANAIINLLKTGVRERLLSEMCATGKLRIVDDVARELRAREGDARRWVNNNQSAVLSPIQAVLDEVVRLAREYGELFTTVGKAADPALVATACYYRSASVRHLIVTDDHGVQAVCILERLEFAPYRAYRALIGA